MFFAPLEGRRHVKVTRRRTKNDWALVVKELVDEMYPRAEKIVLVMDNLNTHTPASLYGRSLRRRPNASPTNWKFTIRPSTARG
jgi:hypothetical protein